MPDSSIICEERPLVDVQSNEKFWLIDPIDGTRSYIQNKDSFTINIALIENKSLHMDLFICPQLIAYILLMKIKNYEVFGSVIEL